jgi:glycosyltransferase involved in cell wall biosynthesis
MRQRIDAVVAYELSALHTFTAAKKIGAACILDAPSIHRAEQDQHYVSRVPTAYKARVDLRKDRELSLADCIFTASDLAAKSYLTNLSSGNWVKTVMLGVDVERFKPKPVSPYIDTLREPFKFAFVGSGTRKKGFDLILDCLEKLLSEGLLIELLVAGRIDQKLLSGRNALRGEVRQFGFVSHAELASLLTSAHCLLLPSLFDSFGMVVAEAMACGLPVIVSNMVGARQLVEEGRNGFVIPVGNREALAQKMRWCVMNWEALAKMSVAARTTAEGASWANYRYHFARAVQEVCRARSRVAS